MKHQAAANNQIAHVAMRTFPNSMCIISKERFPRRFHRINFFSPTIRKFPVALSRCKQETSERFHVRQVNFQEYYLKIKKKLLIDTSMEEISFITVATLLPVTTFSRML